MTRRKIGGGIVLVVLVLATAAVFWTNSQAQPSTNVHAKCTVVETEGTNLVVVDNATNTLYFYTVEPGKEVGSDLLLRGSIDLNEVGKPVIKPKKGGK